MRTVPRYRPTCSLADLARSVRASRDPDLRLRLASRLSGIYGLKHVFLTRTARVGLYALLKAYGRPGEVLVPAYNCIVVPEAVRFAGYSPAFVDIDGRTLNATADRFEAALTPRTTLALATHVFGIPCDLGEIVPALRRRGILVVEDAAPAIGATYGGRPAGTFGDASIISFQSTKVISAELGGALMTNSDDLARRVAPILDGLASPASRWLPFLRLAARKALLQPEVYRLAHATYRLLKREPLFEVVPPVEEQPADFLSSCAAYDCALVLSQLDRLPGNLQKRRRLAAIYQAGLAGHPRLRLPEIPPPADPAWIQFPVAADDKSAFYEFMQRRHVDLSWTFRYSCADSYSAEGFPNARGAAGSVVGLPTYPGLTEDQAGRICRIAASYGRGTSV